MKKILLCLLTGSLFATPGMLAKEIYGYQAWERSETPVRGPIHFDSANPKNATLIKDCTNDAVVYGGYYHNYHWYGQAIVKGTQSSVDGLYEIDMETGERRLIAKQTGDAVKMIDMTYDYSSGKVYGIRHGNQWFAEFDPATGNSRLIGKCSDGGTEKYMLALAAALDGTVYGVSSDDILYKIDKTSGALTKVGDLGVDAGFDQTMAFDYEDGTLYWANNGDYTLYKVDTATGAATAVGKIGKNGISSMASLFVPYINVAAGTPDRVTDAKGKGTLTTAELSWTYPTRTAQGKALTELQGVKVMRDGVQVADVKCKSTDMGKAGSYSDSGVEAGRMYAYELVPYNSKGNGGVDTEKLNVRVGKDIPGAVIGLKATAGDGSAILSWGTPTAGATGGVFDPADITGYEVKRGTKVVATVPASQLQYEDKADYGKYNYTVTPQSEIGAGTPSLLENVMVKPGDWIVMTDGEEKVELGKTYNFYDEGGPYNNYYNSRNNTLVIAPAVADGYIVAEFSKFDVETYGDYLEVYNGRGTSGTKFGQFKAYDAVPAELKHIESTAADGCLTFVFHSDIMESAAGWAATVTAQQRKAHDLEAGLFTAPSVSVAAEEATYTLEVLNKGANPAKGYKVELLDGSTVLASAEGPELGVGAKATVAIKHTLQNAGDYAISARVAYDADADLSNNATAVHTQKVLAAGSAVIEFNQPNPTDLQVAPASFFGPECIWQSIYYAKDLAAGKDKHLMTISFPYTSVTVTYVDVPFHMWVGETDQTDLKAGIVPASKLTDVFHGKATISPNSDALEIMFSTSYEYKGKNLVVMLHKEPSKTGNYGVKFRGDYGYDDSHTGVTRFESHYEGDEPFDGEKSFGYSENNMRPDAKFVFSATSLGVSDVAVDAPLDYSVDGNVLSAGCALRVYNAAGQLVATVGAGEKAKLDGGLYIVVSAAGSAKVAIK